MTRPNASLIQQLIRFSSRHSVAITALALASIAAGQAAPVEASIEQSTTSDGIMPQVSPQTVSTAGRISATATSPTISAAPQFSGSRESEVLLAQSIEAAADGTGSVVTQTGNTFDITGGTQTGANLFHSFEQLGLDAGQVANFLSNPAIQNILGRVVGGDPSVINGLLQVTGGNSNLFLMNPAGIVFGPNAQVIVPGAFTATTASAIQLSDYWFNALGTDDYANLVAAPSGFAFANSSPGTVINAGNLSGESVTLLGGFVVNTGTIDAPGGKITIASVPGENLVRITQEGSLLSLELPVEVQDNLNNEVQALNTIEIPELLSSASAPQNLGLVVDNGVVRLAITNTILPTEAGTTIASGTLDASDAAPGGTGGTIDVLGNRVALLDATLQASGSAGGGTVRVGGDYRGQGTVPNAEQTYVGAGSTIAADALAEGDGGRVIVWADDATRFYGAISAGGGVASGDGGFAEVSGHETLVYDGTANMSAANGAAGTLLLDPRNIRIADEPSTSGVDSQLPDIFANDSLGNDITVRATTLTSQPGNIILEATNDITVDNGLSLAFSACSSPSCSIWFRADADGNGMGSFRMDRTQSITTPGRSLTISGAAVTAGNLSNADNFGDSIRISSNSTISVGDINSNGTIGLYARGSIKTESITNGGGDGVFIESQEGDIQVSAISSGPGVIVIDAEGLFQATGEIERFDLQGSAPPPTLDLDLPENADVKSFLMSQNLLKSNGEINEEFVSPSGHVFIDSNNRFIARPPNDITPQGSTKVLLISTEPGSQRRFVFNDTSGIPVSIVATDNPNARIQITHSGRAVELDPASVQGLTSQNSENIESRTRISIQGNGEGQFVIGPSVARRQNSGNNSFAFRTDLPLFEIFNAEPVIAIRVQDYSPLVFRSNRFPETVSGSAGMILVRDLDTRIGAAVLGIEYEPPQVPRDNSINPEISLTRNSALLASSDSLDNPEEEDSENEDDVCEIFDSNEVLSVEEVAPEECQASTAPETPSVGAQDEETP
ncbi:filamentous hemagglutinin N-terminal domain-containing protein [Nodosilinea sp. LEGE 06152]|uniref:two-partner secretion domain-containing protein n=1 Tax=Nodosilinea sp. LEGE 06152 TaxID=2777966 RepID=UPI0018802E8F|nr:filamentous hemagglutinin N-terminal domain-containing protein [Nodosilinea sp. LEGE 06152]MBE9158219.1 filamentous hemagglutinin N-terminal domain-containing protein [Nodosilinea sp. LEGE 06152]MBE9160629.1 filamentous hemagglutinin N-terminal domain-containing protein [Nodosilinea sp. LEGE 06152]